MAHINATNNSTAKKELMIKILQIEDSGDFRYATAYEKTIKEFIATHKKEVSDL